MNVQEKISFKIKLKLTCHDLIEQRITAAKIAIHDAQNAANNEQKSSSGDKYETARAMSHLEKDMQSRQLAENIKELAALQAVNADIVYTEVTSGAFLRCAQASLFIAAGLGKQKIGDQHIFFLSPGSPLAKSLHHKKTGDHFVFNGVDSVILELY